MREEWAVVYGDSKNHYQAVNKSPTPDVRVAAAIKDLLNAR